MYTKEFYEDEFDQGKMLWWLTRHFGIDKTLSLISLRISKLLVENVYRCLEICEKLLNFSSSKTSESEY